MDIFSSIIGYKRTEDYETVIENDYGKFIRISYGIFHNKFKYTVCSSYGFKDIPYEERWYVENNSTYYGPYGVSGLNETAFRILMKYIRRKEWWRMK